MIIRLSQFITASLLMGSLLISCDKDPNDTGLEYAPDMYVSVPYEPYSQVAQNSVNPMGINMRRPVAGTIPRQVGFEGELPVELMLNYPLAKDDLELAASSLKNPIPSSSAVLEEGKVLYTKYCMPCHGDKGDGNGSVGEIYGGVPNYKASYIVNQSSGHIYHVITKGKGRMYPHGSQILPADRWKIVHYVNQLRDYKGE